VKHRHVPTNDRADLEDLYGEIRRLRKLVKMAQREIARLRKYEARYKSGSNSKQLSESPTKSTKLRSDACSACADGTVRRLDLVSRAYAVCDSCDFRERIDG
jgi:hypothetical protein